MAITSPGKCDEAPKAAAASFAPERVKTIGGETRALWYVAPGCVELRAQALDATNDISVSDEKLLRVRTLYSAISRGTERLVFEGRVPESEYQRMRSPFQEGAFPFPVKYGYCAAGIVEDGPREWMGRNIFALHPHQDRFTIECSAAALVPDNLPPRRACLAANMETALNALWDSGAGPGDQILVIGGGVVGLLCAYLSARLPGADVFVCDIDETRKSIAESFGARFIAPCDLAQVDRDKTDLVFHASATPQGLKAAIENAGLEARIIELSWYGEGEIAASLGGAFHSRRLQLIGSQVGAIAPTRRPRWDYARRMAKALHLLGDEKLDALITDEFLFAELPQKLPQFFAKGAPGLTAVVKY